MITTYYYWEGLFLVRDKFDVQEWERTTTRDIFFTQGEEVIKTWFKD